MTRRTKDFAHATLSTFCLVSFLTVVALGSWKLCSLVWGGLAGLILGSP